MISKDDPDDDFKELVSVLNKIDHLYFEDSPAVAEMYDAKGLLMDAQEALTAANSSIALKDKEIEQLREELKRKQ